MRAPKLRRRPRQERERGAILVEFVIVIPLFMVIVLGIFEIGKAWESNQTVVQAARSGARTVTQLGQHSQADHQAVQAIMATFGNDQGDVQRIVIFEADANGDAPSGCLSGSAPSGAECNVYGPAEFADIGDDSEWADTDDWGCATGDHSDNWCPSDRNNQQRTAEYVGVRVEFVEQYQTGFFGGGTYVITETTVMRIEPDAD